ncbi:hypothetical protein JCM3770_007072 [Rhodotorula araucariae]
MRNGEAGFEADVGVKLYNLLITTIGGKGDDVGANKGANGTVVNLTPQNVINGRAPLAAQGQLPAGCAGSYAIAKNPNSWFSLTGTIPGGSPVASARIFVQYVGTCDPLAAESTTAPSPTVVETASRAVAETIVPGATVTSTVEELATSTLPTSSVYTTEDVYTTPSTSTVDTTEISVTTPLTSTIQEKTTVTTDSDYSRTPVATVYKTQWVTAEPPTSTIKATQTVSTGGYANCLTYRIVYPSVCCPSRFMSLSSVQQQQAQRRTTVLTTSTRTVEAEASLTTVTPLRTLEAPTPLSASTHIVYFEAPTPLATSTSTRFVAPRRPLASLQALLNPTTTLTLTSTSALATPLATQTVTETVQGTACAETTVKPLTRCFFGANGAGDLQLQARQRALLDQYRAESGRPVTVDCGAGAVFTY